jgi:hypothetical protein
MNSSRIHKIAKARRYAEEPGRIQFFTFEVRFQGDNDVHTVAFDDGILGVTLPVSSRPVLPASTGLLRPSKRTSTP